MNIYYQCRDNLTTNKAPYLYTTYNCQGGGKRGRIEPVYYHGQIDTPIHTLKHTYRHTIGLIHPNKARYLFTTYNRQGEGKKREDKNQCR